MLKTILLLLISLWCCATAVADETVVQKNPAANETAIQEDQVVEVAGPEPLPPFELLGEHIPSGESRLLKLTTGQSLFGQPLEIPVSINHGNNPGPTLCLIAAVHGDELNGIEAVRRILEETDPLELSGTLIGVPVANVQGLAHGTRYLPDRRDLNRYFPGRNRGSMASRLAYLLFNKIVMHCDDLVDFHTGSFKRINLPQLRADMSNDAIRNLALHFSIPILHKPAAAGTLRAAAADHNIAAVTFELGEPSIIEPAHVESGVAVIQALLRSLHMLNNENNTVIPAEKTQPTFYRSHWVRVNHGGILTSMVILGEIVERDALIGVSINPLTNERYEIRSPVAGRILGMARNQFMLPGFAAFHIGHLSEDTAPDESKNEGNEESEVYD